MRRRKNNSCRASALPTAGPTTGSCAAGFGIYYNVHQLNNFTILNLNPPKSGTSTFNNTASGGRIANAPAQPVLTYTNPFGTQNNTRATGLNALDQKNNQPYITQWSLDVQRRLPFDTVLGVGYVGNKGTHIDNTIEFNAPTPAVGLDPNTRRDHPLLRGRRGRAASAR